MQTFALPVTGSIAIVGRPASGKTKALHSLIAQAIQTRRTVTLITDRPGAFESSPWVYKPGTKLQVLAALRSAARAVTGRWVQTPGPIVIVDDFDAQSPKVERLVQRLAGTSAVVVRTQHLWDSELSVPTHLTLFLVPAGFDLGAVEVATDYPQLPPHTLRNLEALASAGAPGFGVLMERLSGSGLVRVGASERT